VKQTLLAAVAGALLLAGCAVSPHGGPRVLYDLQSLAPKMGSGTTKPTIEGKGGGSPETALAIRTAHKEHLRMEEFYWVHRLYWPPVKPGLPPADYSASWSEFYRNTSHETKRIGRSVYDIVTLTLPSGERAVTYFDVTRQRFYWPREK
jgi:hypothetical protein